MERAVQVELHVSCRSIDGVARVGLNEIGLPATGGDDEIEIQLGGRCDS